MSITGSNPSTEEPKNQIYLRIPVMVMLREMRCDPDLKFPVIVSYRSSSNMGSEWQCNCMEDLENIELYFNRLHQTNMSQQKDAYIYRIGTFRGKVYVEIANYARMVVNRADFPEIADDSVIITQNTITLVYERIKEWQFDGRKVSGKIVRKSM